MTLNYKFYIDFDGVLTHSIKSVVDILNKRYNKNIKPNEIKTWYFEEYDNIVTSEDIEDIFSSEEFFSNLTFIEPIANWLKERIDDCLIVTKGGYENAKLKRKFLDDNGFKDLKMICLPFNVDKSIINMQGGIFIDDSVDNLEKSNADVKILFLEYNDNVEREWQKDWNDIIAYDDNGKLGMNFGNRS